ncbi:MAG: hypothetical protein WCG78_07255 [Candidatus Omnitrophota bacterium]
MSLHSKIAPRDIILADFKGLRGNERLDTTPRVEELIFIQSIEGRAHNGSGAFHKRSYVNTTIDDIVRALDKEPKVIKERRQALIDEIVEFVDRVIAGEKPDLLLSKRGTPLLGIPLFKTRRVNAHDIMRGLYLGGLRDAAAIRREAEKRYQVTIGYGHCYLVNIEVMDRMGQDGDSLAHQEHEDSIEDLRARGLIIDRAQADELGEEKVRYLYIRHKIGPGQSDDAAIINAGFLYKSVDVALGVFLADSIDTLEKYVPVYSDQDQDLSAYIKERYGALDLTLDDVYQLTYLSAIPEGKEEEVPDSSIRYFLTVDPRTGQSTFECHLNFIEGKPFFPMAISYKHILVTTFYEYIKERIADVLRSNDILPLGVAGSLGECVNRPIKEVLHKSFIEVSGEQGLCDVLKELRNSPADVIIVKDQGGATIGVLDSSDFLRLLTTK